MSSLVALSVSIAVLGGIATALCLGPLSGIVLIWTVFISWACFFAIGGDNKALQNTIVCGALGAVIAWIAMLIILAVPSAQAALTLPVWAGIVVGVTVLAMCLLAQVETFSAIPASVLGYASVASFALTTPGARTMEMLTSPSFGNALVVIVISFAVGAVCGLVSGKLGGVLTTK